MEGFTAIRNGILEHLRLGKLTPLEFAVYVVILMRADYQTGIYHGSALHLAYDMGCPGDWDRVRKALYRLKRKGYLNYPKGDGTKGGYEVLIHKYEPTMGRWVGYRLDAWKNGTSCRPEYERITGLTPESAMKGRGEERESAINKDLRLKTKDKSKAAAALEIKMRMRRRDNLTDDEIAQCEVHEVFAWAMERAARFKGLSEKAGGGYAPEILQAESLIAAIVQQSSTEELEALKRTHLMGSGKCPQAIFDELQKRGVTEPTETVTIHAASTGCRLPTRISKRTVIVLQRLLGTYMRRVWSKTDRGSSRQTCLRWASRNLGRRVRSLSQLRYREAAKLMSIVLGERKDDCWPLRALRTPSKVMHLRIPVPCKQNRA